MDRTRKNGAPGGGVEDGRVCTGRRARPLGRSQRGRSGVHAARRGAVARRARGRPARRRRTRTIRADDPGPRAVVRAAAARKRGPHERYEVVGLADQEAHEEEAHDVHRRLRSREGRCRRRIDRVRGAGFAAGDGSSAFAVRDSRCGIRGGGIVLSRVRAPIRLSDCEPRARAERPSRSGPPVGPLEQLLRYLNPRRRPNTRHVVAADVSVIDVATRGTTADASPGLALSRNPALGVFRRGPAGERVIA